jgi:predicted NAD/FAD-binding protein
VTVAAAELALPRERSVSHVQAIDALAFRMARAALHADARIVRIRSRITKMAGILAPKLLRML